MKTMGWSVVIIAAVSVVAMVVVLVAGGGVGRADPALARHGSTGVTAGYGAGGYGATAVGVSGDTHGTDYVDRPPHGPGTDAEQRQPTGGPGARYSPHEGRNRLGRPLHYWTIIGG